MKNIIDILNESRLQINAGRDFDSMPRDLNVFYDDEAYIKHQEDDSSFDTATLRVAELDTDDWDSQAHKDAETAEWVMMKLTRNTPAFISVDNMTLSEAISGRNCQRVVEYVDDLDRYYRKNVMRDHDNGHKIFVENGKLIFEYIISRTKRTRKYIYALTEDGKQAVLDHGEDFTNASEWLQPDMIYIIKVDR